MDRPNLEVRTPRVGHRVLLRRHPRGRRRASPRNAADRADRRRRGDPLRRRDQLAAAAPALGRRQRRASSSALGDRAGPRPARRRREPPGPPRGLRPVRLQAAGVGGAGAEVAQPPEGRRSQWLLGRSGPGATNHFEAGGFVRSNDDVAYPNLMFHFLPVAIRYDGSAPQGHGYQVHVGPMYSDARGSVKIISTDPRRCTRRCASTTCRPTGPPRVGRGDPGRARRSSPSRRSTRSTTASSRQAPSVADRRADPRLGRPRRRDGAAPVLHLPPGDRRGLGASTRRRMRVHGLDGHPRRRRLGDALRHQRQHLRADDDARREGADLIRGNTPLAPITEPFYRTAATTARRTAGSPS